MFPTFNPPKSYRKYNRQSKRAKNFVARTKTRQTTNRARHLRRIHEREMNVAATIAQILHEATHGAKEIEIDDAERVASTVFEQGTSTKYAALEFIKTQFAELRTYARSCTIKIDVNRFYMLLVFVALMHAMTFPMRAAPTDPTFFDMASSYFSTLGMAGTFAESKFKVSLPWASVITECATKLKGVGTGIRFVNSARGVYPMTPNQGVGAALNFLEYNTSPLGTAVRTAKYAHAAKSGVNVLRTSPNSILDTTTAATRSVVGEVLKPAGNIYKEQIAPLL